MKKPFLIVLIFLVSFSYSQEKKIEIDYVVDYVIPNKRKQSKDTISIGYDKDGKYLWTNYREFTKEFTNAFLQNSGETEIPGSNSNLILETKTTDIFFNFEGNDIALFFKVNLNTFIPVDKSDAINDHVVLVSEKTDRTSSIINSEFMDYALYADKEPESIIYANFDEDLPVNNNFIFQKFLELMMKKTDSEGSITTNLPKGLILKINDGNTTMLEAIKIHKEKKVIDINYSFKVTE